jgi:hypothetical protein
VHKCIKSKQAVFDLLSTRHNVKKMLIIARRYSLRRVKPMSSKNTIPTKKYLPPSSGYFKCQQIDVSARIWKWSGSQLSSVSARISCDWKSGSAYNKCHWACIYPHGLAFHFHGLILIANEIRASVIHPGREASNWQPIKPWNQSSCLAWRDYPICRNRKSVAGSADI